KRRTLNLYIIFFKQKMANERYNTRDRGTPLMKQPLKNNNFIEPYRSIIFTREIKQFEEYQNTLVNTFGSVEPITSEDFQRLFVSFLTSLPWHIDVHKEMRNYDNTDASIHSKLIYTKRLCPSLQMGYALIQQQEQQQ